MVVDKFSAVPRIQRFIVTIVDEEKLPAFYESTNLNEPIPTKTAIYIGYENGPGCPATVVMEVDQIQTEYAAIRPTDEERPSFNEATGEQTPGTISINEYYDKLRRANMLLRRNLLLAVIRGMDRESANLLANPDAEGGIMLAKLGYITDHRVPEEKEEEEEEENKEEGEVVTGESS